LMSFFILVICPFYLHVQNNGWNLFIMPSYLKWHLLFSFLILIR
jgi:hypothetical protein